jgi:hypothetical protein
MSDKQLTQSSENISNTEISNALLPCPFCGTIPIMRWVFKAKSNARWWEIRCPECKMGLCRQKKKTALFHWNKRTNIQALQNSISKQEVIEILEGMKYAGGNELLDTSKSYNRAIEDMKANIGEM